MSILHLAWRVSDWDADLPRAGKAKAERAGEIPGTGLERGARSRESKTIAALSGEGKLLILKHLNTGFNLLLH